MTSLIWMLAWLPQVLPAMTKLPEPINVKITSVYFMHELKWDPGAGTPAGVYYRVTVNTDRGTSWVPVAGCERVQHSLVCNLTEAFSDPEQSYFARVTAVLDSESSTAVTTVDKGFLPIRDTQLDLPLLKVTPCERNLCVDLQPPMKHLREIYEPLQYELKIQSNSMDTVKDTRLLRREVLNLAPGKKYCVSVRFADSEVPRKSNFSQPVCAFTPGTFATDQLIAGVLCALVLCVAAILALLVCAGYICLKQRPQPQSLSSIHHIEDPPVLTLHPTSVSPLLNLRPTPPSSGEARSSQTADSSDEESVTECSSGGGGGGGNYARRLGTNLLSLSSSSSSLAAPSSPKPQPTPSSSSNQTSDFIIPPPLPSTSAGRPNDPLSALTASRSDPPPASPQRASAPPADCLTGGRLQQDEEEEEVGDVDLLTLTFGGYEEEEEEEESHVKSKSASEETTPMLPVPTQDAKEVAIETVSCSVNEEEEEEDSGYIGRA